MVEKLSYWRRDADELRSEAELCWNFPEQKTGAVAIIGGSLGNFANEVRLSEFFSGKLPFFLEVKNYFPDSLKANFPRGLLGLEFFPSTESGSFARSPELNSSLMKVGAAVLFGDFSKNSETAISISELLERSFDTEMVLTRDAVDLVAPEAERWLDRDNVTIIASLAQLQKVFRAVYYPRPILLSQPLLPTVETLHKFTLSYPVGILTFHEGEIIAAVDGKILSMPIERSDYSPISLWSGEVAAKALTFLKFNRKKRAESLIAAVKYKV